MDTDETPVDDAPPGGSWAEVTGAEDEELAARRHAVASPGQVIPAAVRPYLKRDERQAMCTRQHPAMLILPALALAAAVAELPAALAVRAIPALASCAVALAAASWAAARWLAWRSGWLVITADRVMVIQGVLRRRADMLPFSKLRDLAVSETLPGRVFGYGTLHCESIGTGGALGTIVMVPRPQEFYARACEMVLPAEGKRGPGR